MALVYVAGLNPDEGDYRLHYLSPALDLGTTVSFEYNHDAMPREIGEAVDIGAYEGFVTASKPPMGWCSWSVFGGDVTEKQLRATADFIATQTVYWDGPRS